MTDEKFIGEVKTLRKFFTKYCEDKHHNQREFTKKLSYNNINYDINLNLCDECNELINYSFNRLNECPHDIKPRCRTCPSPCYEKQEWKKLSKLMKYSGLQFGLIKIKKLFKKNKKDENGNIK
jgi:hypothetical protein